MPPKRPVEVLELSDSEDDARPAPAAPAPALRRTAQPGRDSSESAARGGLGDEGGPPGEDEEDAALALAIRLSLEEEARRSAAGGSAAGPSPSTSTGGAPRLSDRAELERQRLARQRARGDAAPQTVRVASTSTGPGAGARVKTFADLLAPDGDAESGPRAASSSTSHRTSSSSSSNKHSHRFWRGAVKRVPSKFHPDADSYSFADLIGSASTLQAAVVSAYVYEPEWVVSHFADETPLLLVQARLKGDTQPALAVCSLKPNCFRVVPKERLNGPYPGVMHTKFMVRPSRSLSLSLSLSRRRRPLSLPSR